ncbi:DUF397 domain-containing protein [Streptomyces sp. NBC_00184]|uniref:DUF397 domain-containing protein n=1 Tax=Streptomyces sp. NBC_00184 TaxID=2975673 RepID=UPI002E2B3FB7|nr:DUF397 domain-containing protein [Streptomyces sp. NBC_00184]
MIDKPCAVDAAEPSWFRSSYSSSGDGNDCVEVAAAPHTVHVRDSKRAQGPRLACDPAAWAAFVAYAAQG